MRARLNRLISGILVAAFAAGALAAELVTRKNSVGGVTVAVTPRNPAANAGTWEFKVVFDTHTAELKDDVVKNAILVVDGAASHAPATWQGDPPGGHHREGVLRFNAVSPRPKAIELRIQRPGEPKPRSFLWRLD